MLSALRLDCGSAEMAAPDYPAPQLTALHDYWDAKRRPGRLPSRADIRPEEIHRLLPHLVLYDVLRPERVEGDGYDFRARLVGTAVSQLFGREITGRKLSEVADLIDFVRVQRRLGAVVDCRGPESGISRVHHPERAFLKFAHLTLPLAGDGQTVDMLLGARVEIRN
jgi:hypothetical protein